MAEAWLNGTMGAVALNFQTAESLERVGSMPALAVNFHKAEAFELHRTMASFSVTFNTAESLQRSFARVQRPPRAALRLLRDMGEHKSFWFALRRHGDEQVAMRWLAKLHATSNWAEQKFSPSELLRKEYLRLLDCIKAFDPDYQDGWSR